MVVTGLIMYHHIPNQWSVTPTPIWNERTTPHSDELDLYELSYCRPQYYQKSRSFHKQVGPIGGSWICVNRRGAVWHHWRTRTHALIHSA